MKKFATMLICASILLSGCGNNDTQQKVEQKAEEVKQDATQAAEQVQKDAEQAKNDAAQKVDEVKNDAAQLAQSALNILDAAKSLFNDSREVPLAGVLPGIALDKLVEAFGEPVIRDGDKWTFGNGLTVDMNQVKNIVEKIIIRTPDIATPEGVAVGMDEDVLNTAYGPADKVDVDKEDGEVDYEYFNKDKTRSITFTSQNGVITEIESEIHD